MGDELSDLDRAVLDFERTPFRFRGYKETKIREKFGWSATRYAIQLNKLRENPAALAYALAVVRRLNGTPRV